MKTIVAGKAVIIENEKVIVLKRSSDDNFRPGTYDLPGGKVEHGENPILGLKREVEEEIGLMINVIAPTRIWDFVIDDTHTIGITYFCRLIGGSEKLSHEHDGYEWIKLSEIEKKDLPKWLKEDIVTVMKRLKDRL